MTAEREKYSHVSKMLDSRVSNEVRELLVNVPEETPYTKLKTEIIKRMCSSQEEKTRKLLEREELGDRKPSQFLRHLQTLAGSSMSDTMMRTLWSGRLPASMQPILAIHKETELDKVAEMADHIHDLTKNRSVVAETTSATKNLIHQFNQMMSSMQQELTKLRSEVSEIRGRSDKKPNGRSRSRDRSQSRGPYASDGVCWYHARFGNNATKCTKPCKFVAGNALASP